MSAQDKEDLRGIIQKYRRDKLLIDADKLNGLTLEEILHRARMYSGGGVSAHSELTGIGVNDHHAQTHKDSHKSGGADAFASTDLLDAIITRLKESSGPTTLTLGAVAEGEYLKRSGTSVIGSSGTSTNFRLLPQYTVYVSGGVCYVMKYDGSIPYSNADASTAINWAISNLSHTDYEKAKVSLIGTFYLNKVTGKPFCVYVDEKVILDLQQAYLYLNNTQNCDIIRMEGDNSNYRGSHILGGFLNGNKANQTSGHGISVDMGSQNVLEDTIVLNADDDGFHLFRTQSDLTVDAAAGQKDCTVADGTKFWAGQTVLIREVIAGATGLNEINTVASVVGNIVTMTDNLVNTYQVADNGEVGHQNTWGGWHQFRHCQAWSADNHGFSINDNSDCHFMNCIPQSSGQDGFYAPWGGQVFEMCHPTYSGRYGFYVSACILNNCYSNRSVNNGLRETYGGSRINNLHVDGASYGVENTNSAVYVSSDNNEFIGGYFNGKRISSWQSAIYCINLSGNNNIFKGVRVSMDAYGTGEVNWGGTGNVFDDCIGFITRNKGASSILSGTTSIVVNHGLGGTYTSITPVAQDFTIIGKENPTNDIGAIWVDTITATQFTVNVENDPGASNWDFGWRVNHSR